MSERVDLTKAISGSPEGLEVYTVEAFNVTDEMLELLSVGFRYSDGEMTAGDFLRQVANGLGTLFVGFQRGKLITVMGTEFVQYARKKTLRVLCAAGSVATFAEFLKFIDSWAEQNGAIEVEAACRESVARLLRRWKFREVYRLVRRPVKEIVQ